MNFKINKEDTLLIKGIGILLIIFHNYFHVCLPFDFFNEFEFSPVNWICFLNTIKTGPEKVIPLISAYFGHYGVHFFIFISGYGLTLKFSKSQFIFKNFIFQRLIKLYPAFIIAVIMLLIYQYILFDFNFTYRTVVSIFIRVFQVANFIPGKAFALSGTYWFYSLIIQLYLVFPFLLFLSKKNPILLWIVLFITYLFILFTNNFFSSIKLSLYYNFVGNLPVFILGIVFGLNINLKLPVWIWIILPIAFIIGQIDEYFWHFTQILFVLFWVPVIIRLGENFKTSKAVKFIKFTGQLSMYLFAVNGFLRYPWTKMTQEKNLIIYSLVYFLSFFIIIYIVAIVVRELEKIILTRLRKYKIISNYQK